VVGVEAAGVVSAGAGEFCAAAKGAAEHNANNARIRLNRDFINNSLRNFEEKAD
jgi:hypothetical protein